MRTRAVRGRPKGKYMKRRQLMRYGLTALAALVTLMASVVPAAQAQTITGTPGSPSATTTIDGRELPAPPGKFGGTIGETATKSKPNWLPRIVPPKGAECAQVFSWPRRIEDSARLTVEKINGGG